MNTADLIGIFGVICYQIAYAGLQLGFLQREDRRYLVLNLFGPCCLLYSLLFHFNLAAAVSQVLWLVWSGLGIRKIMLAQRGASVATIGNACAATGIATPIARVDMPMTQVSVPAQETREFGSAEDRK
ncbi:hypothetical protein LMG28688_05219 [Paraburkholderia caffeinitolerans]|uniref:CBU-0592-like domain-containing protein n=1 Tax=Paraburkholderia caffeinitolerans TaxID=1723730 RepID=A0A6J5GNN9_9BURK|nr:hypothetical protein [Paraburkholderia caffeinitolerans]CAB3800730.1 hypothetical protein LMG28688_05219 [Paraburkholderia caffeinitolerans]